MVGKIKGGLYLIVDPTPGLLEIYPKVKSALEGGVDVIQIWDNWSSCKSQNEFISELCDLAHHYNVPVLINNHWRWLRGFSLDGVHFDEIPSDINHIKKQIGRPCFVGITCGNNQNKIEWAILNKLDYISFCSMFQSSTSTSCDLVNQDLVKQVSAKTAIPIYVSGGITVENLPSLIPLGVSGVAIVSRIMNAKDPSLAATKFKQFFNNQKTR